MTKQEALDKIEELKKFVEQSDKKKGRFRAGANKSYWCIRDDNFIFMAVEDFMEVDNGRYAIGNYFETREQAEKEVARRKVITKLRDLNEGFEPDWGDDSQIKYHLVKDYNLGKWRTDNWYSNQYSFDLPHFASEHALQNAIDTLGDELDVLLD